MKPAKYLTVFSVFSLIAGVTLPVQAITSSGNLLDNITSEVDDGTEDDFREGALEDDTLVRFFEEQTNFELTSDLTLDATLPDDKGKDLTSGDGTESTISSGKEINSYYFHYDPSGSNETGSDTTKGNSSDFTATFNDEAIQGLIFEGSSMTDSNSIVGRDNVDYPSATGIEDNSGGTDIISFKDSDNVEVKEFIAGAAVDSFRVITQDTGDPEAVPFEAEGTMGLVALGSFLGYRYFKKRKQALSQ